MSINMNEQVKTINYYYTSLKYNNIRSEALEKISTLSMELKFKDTDDFSYRFSETASLIQKNLTVFMTACDHVDVITTIIDYFIHFGVSSRLEDASAEHDENETVMCIMLTIYNIYKEYAIQLFLETAIIKESDMEVYNHFKEVIRPCIKMILLEDSDMYAVINYLKIKNALFHIDEIWVQESIEQTFMWHLKKYFGDLKIHHCTFRSKEELLLTFSTSEYYAHLNIVSIWSENITAAKHIADSLNQNVLFINSYMDFCFHIVLPYTDLYFKSLYESFKLNQIHKRIYTNPINQTHEDLTYDLSCDLTYDLFYDSMWQKPKKNTYWIHNNILLANATRKDIIACIESAIKGFKTWNNMSSEFRRQMLFLFASALEIKGDSYWANKVRKWINLSYTCGRESTRYNTDRFEVIKIRKPQGTVILKEIDQLTLFQELIQSLIIGNSVIVICNPDLCLLAQYCTMIQKSGIIPPGVINLLSSKNTDFKYDNYEYSTTKMLETLTLMQHIVVALK